MLEQPQPQTDTRDLIRRLQEMGAFEDLSTSQIEQLLSRLKSEKIEGLVMPNAAGVSFQDEEGSQVAASDDRSRKTSAEETQSLADIFNQMRGAK